MALVLLYNLRGEKLRRVQAALLRHGLQGREVDRSEYGHPIGYLAGMEGWEPGEEYAGEGFAAEMLVMHALNPRQFNGLLDALRSFRAAVALKAVITESNAGWDSVALCKALQEEHDAMRELLEARKKK